MRQMSNQSTTIDVSHLYLTKATLKGILSHKEEEITVFFIKKGM